MAIDKIQVGEKKQKKQITLPSEAVELLKNLTLKERKEYIKALRNEGWTCQSIGEVLGVSRQRIDQIAKEVTVITGSYYVPKVPSTPIYKFKAKEVEPEILEQLKELHAKASLVRSSSPNYRKEAEQFTKLAWEQTQKGVTVYSLAKSLGVTHGALYFRFVRYGYATSNGKSKTYNKILFREKGTTNV